MTSSLIPTPTITTPTPTKGIISVAVVGTNETTRETKNVVKNFDLNGNQLDTSGTPIPSAAKLNIDFSKTDDLPEPFFNNEAFKAAAVVLDKPLMDSMLANHATAIEEWQKSSGGGTPALRIAKAVHAYCLTEEGFIEQDGEGYVLPLKNLDVSVNTQGEGPTAQVVYVVAGTAVFG